MAEPVVGAARRLSVWLSSLSATTAVPFVCVSGGVCVTSSSVTLRYSFFT